MGVAHTSTVIFMCFLSTYIILTKIRSHFFRQRKLPSANNTKSSPTTDTVVTNLIIRFSSDGILQSHGPFKYLMPIARVMLCVLQFLAKRNAHRVAIGVKPFEGHHSDESQAY